MPESNAEFDELLSAYLDGELRGEELARVERQLTDDPHARDMLEEFRSLSASLKRLPREQVDTTLSARIHQRLEQTIPPHPTLASSRRWVWPLFAAAAALLVMLFLSDDRQKNKPLAAVDAKQPAPEPRDADRLQLKAPAAAETDFAPLPAEPERELADESGQMDGRELSESIVDGFVTDQTTAKAATASAAAMPQFQCVVTLNVNDANIAERDLQQKLKSSGLKQFTLGGSRAALRTRAPNDPEGSRQVLAEATAAQLDQVLQTYHGNPLLCQSLSVSSTVPEAVPLVQWQRWERSDKETPPAQAAAPVPLSSRAQTDGFATSDFEPREERSYFGKSKEPYRILFVIKPIARPSAE